MADDGLHEVQLNGKQLVFAFMVGTVIAVVIFLCGVLVGRGLRPSTASIDLAAADATSTVDPTQSISSPPSPPPSDGTPVSARESLTYPERLESSTPLADDLREPARPIAEPSPRAAAPAPAPTAAAARKPEPAEAAPARPEPPGTGFVVQVMAVNARAEADTVARRLSGKGYPAFVTTTGTGTNVSYRVRVGKYDTQREAEAVSSRLQKEEQFKPWVTK